MCSTASNAQSKRWHLVVSIAAVTSSVTASKPVESSFVARTAPIPRARKISAIAFEGSIEPGGLLTRVSPVWHHPAKCFLPLFSLEQPWLGSRALALQRLRRPEAHLGSVSWSSQAPLFGRLRDQSRPAIEGQVGPSPLQQHGNAIAEPDEEEDVHEEP